MSKTNEIATQTGIRRRLLSNGYVPLANKDKMCVLFGWSEMHVDEAKIDEWANQLKWRATGVRVEGGLAVIDLDVNSADAIDAIVEALPEDLWAKLSLAPVRRGKGDKEAWFVRLAEGEEAFYRLASAGFKEPDAGDEGAVQRVEIFAGDGGRQFGVYGAHTIGEDGEVAVQYRWSAERGLADVALADLPAVTRADLALVADTATRVLDEMGWRRDLRSKAGFSSNVPIYDLDGQTFATRDHGDVDLAGLEDLCAQHGDVRLSASWLEGDAAVNMTRCIASIHPRDGRVSVLETASFESHRPKALEPRPITQGALERLQALAAGGTIFDRGVTPTAIAPTAAEVGVGMAGDMDSVVDALLGEYVYIPSEHRCVASLSGGPASAMTLANFKTLMQPHAVTVQGPRGGERVVHPVALWVADPRRIDVAGFRFRPDVQDRLIHDAGQVYANAYQPLPWPEVSVSEVLSAGAAFEALLTHLVPDGEARAWFRMWLAAKVQTPQAANCGVLLIAKQQGTGRGTLFDMMQAVIGKPYYKSISSTELLGQGAQGVYTAWQASALLVTVDEVMAGGDTGTSMGWKRREAYERIKQLVDPRQRTAQIRQKGLQNYEQEVFFSLLMATNHFDALPLDQNDRRIAALIQPDIRFEDDAALKALVNPWRAGGSFGEVFGAALRRHLLRVPVDLSVLRIAPELGGGREVMRDANEGDLEDILRSVLGKVPADYMLNRDLKRRMQVAITAEGEGDHLKNWWVRVQDILKRPNAFGWSSMPTRQNYVDESGHMNRGVIYVRDGADAGLWQATSMADRSALIAPAADINRALSAAAKALRDGRLTVIDNVLSRGETPPSS